MSAIEYWAAAALSIATGYVTGLLLWQLSEEVAPKWRSMSRREFFKRVIRDLRGKE